MSPADLYVHAAVNRHRALDDDSHPDRLRCQVERMLHLWAFAPWVESVTLSGSIPKGTALRESDVDLFLSLAPETPGPLAEIHSSLAHYFRDFLPRPRNVSLRVHFEGSSIDLVPARRRASSAPYTLWQLSTRPGCKRMSPNKSATSAAVA